MRLARTLAAARRARGRSRRLWLGRRRLRGAGTYRTQACSAVAARALLLARGRMAPRPVRLSTRQAHRSWPCQCTSETLVNRILPIALSAPVRPGRRFSRFRTNRRSAGSHCAPNQGVAMPVYEYACQGCGQEFEALVRTGTVPDRRPVIRPSSKSGFPSSRRLERTPRPSRPWRARAVRADIQGARGPVVGTEADTGKSAMVTDRDRQNGTTTGDHRR